MIELLRELRSHFDGMEDRLLAFSKYGFQAEGWLKTELITWLDAAQEHGRLARVQREIPTESRKKVDLAIDLDDERNWIELKHWLVGKQAGQTFRAGFYFGDDAGFGLHRDAEKLVSTTSSGGLWILVLVTANPGEAEWMEGIQKYHAKFHGPQVVSRSNPRAFPSHYCLGLFEVVRK